MSSQTTIEWTDATWNPLRGCSRESAGCVNCYAEKIAARYSDPGQPFHGLATRGPARWTNEVRFVDHKVTEPLKWREPKRIFVNSMSDLFHPKVERRWLIRIFAAMALCPDHTFQLLTKRPQIMSAFIDSAPWAEIAEEVKTMARGHFGSLGRYDRAQQAIDRALGSGSTPPWDHVWWGFSAEDQDTFNRRWVASASAVRAGFKVWRSLEPQIDEVEVFSINGPIDVPDGEPPPLRCIVQGFESGPKARPGNTVWARRTRDECAAVGCRYFFKQWGVWWPASQTDDPKARLAEAGRNLVFMPPNDAGLKNWDPTKAGWPKGTHATLDGVHYLAGPFEDDGLWKK